MSGISGSGLISGIDTASLIDQLIAASSGPSRLAQARLFQLQAQQAAYLDLNSQLGSLRSAAASFRTNNTFQAKKATSSNGDILTATASIGAQPGTYSFVVDRLVSSRQLLTRGFVDRDQTELGATSFSFDSYRARLDDDVSLSALNDGDGIERGEIRITDADGDSATVDLSRAATVSDVLDAINQAGIDVTARVSDGRFELIGADSVTNVGTRDTRGTLGLGAGADTTGDDIIGTRVYGITVNTALSSLNDGTGVDYRSNSSVPDGAATDFTIDFSNGASIDVGIGEIRVANEVTEGAVTTVQGVLDRINDAIAADGTVDATASIDADTGGIVITTSDGATVDAITQVGNATTVRDLGLDLDAGALGGTTATGKRIFSGLGTTLLSGLNGGGASGGFGGSGRLSITVGTGTSYSFDLGDGSLETVEDLIAYIESETSGDVSVSLNRAGTGLRLDDASGGTGNLIVVGDTGDDTAESLGISTGATGTDAGYVDGSNLQRRYIGEATRLSSLRNGEGIGTGEIRIIDANGDIGTVNITDDQKTVADLLRHINSQLPASVDVDISINEQGDGLKITSTGTGGTAIRVEDVSGRVAANLNLAGEAEDPATDNSIDGSFETTVEFDPTDTLDDIVSKLNDSGAGVSVSVLNDGSGTRPFRLSFTSQGSGVAGRFTLDTNGFDLGISVLDEGEDSRVFFGSNDPASGILLTSSTNTLDDVITGVNIDLNSTSDEAVTLTITDDTAGIESRVKELVDAYNRVIGSINTSTAYDEDTGARGALLGDGLLLGLRSGMFGTVQGTNFGFDGTFSRLSEVGVTVGSDGLLEFDSEQFREALNEDPEAVEDLFTRRTIDDDDDSGDDDLPDGVTSSDPTDEDTFSELGVVALLEEFAKNYTDSIDGILTSRTQSLDTQILSQQSRIEDLQEGLNRQRESLQRQFIAMEQALAQLQSQQSALSSLTQLG
jgi:flagellar hook-associated protein 2